MGRYQSRQFEVPGIRDGRARDDVDEPASWAAPSLPERYRLYQQ
ncbi:hypothetical protein [Marinobacter mobilis]|nr:hypothetical protein [Marinobacter mobilis]